MRRDIAGEGRNAISPEPRRSRRMSPACRQENAPRFMPLSTKRPTPPSQPTAFCCDAFITPATPLFSEGNAYVMVRAPRHPECLFSTQTPGRTQRKYSAKICSRYRQQSKRLLTHAPPANICSTSAWPREDNLIWCSCEPERRRKSHAATEFSTRGARHARCRSGEHEGDEASARENAAARQCSA